MKIVGIVGSNSDFSYNRILLQYIKKHFDYLFELEVLEIKDVPMFNQSDAPFLDDPAVAELKEKISAADGVIITTPEHNRTFPSCLKSALEWLSFENYPFKNKPVMVLGASYFEQGAARAQLHLRQILDAPGLEALVMPGHEFLLGNVKEAFNSHGDLKDGPTVAFLGQGLGKFAKFVKVAEQLK